MRSHMQLAVRLLALSRPQFTLNFELRLQRIQAQVGSRGVGTVLGVALRRVPPRASARDGMKLVLSAALSSSGATGAPGVANIRPRPSPASTSRFLLGRQRLPACEGIARDHHCARRGSAARFAPGLGSGVVREDVFSPAETLGGWRGHSGRPPRPPSFPFALVAFLTAFGRECGPGEIKAVRGMGLRPVARHVCARELQRNRGLSPTDGALSQHSRLLATSVP